MLRKRANALSAAVWIVAIVIISSKIKCADSIFWDSEEDSSSTEDYDDDDVYVVISVGNANNGTGSEATPGNSEALTARRSETVGPSSGTSNPASSSTYYHPVYMPMNEAHNDHQQNHYHSQPQPTQPQYPGPPPHALVQLINQYGGQSGPLGFYNQPNPQYHQNYCPRCVWKDHAPPIKSKNRKYVLKLSVRKCENGTLCRSNSSANVENGNVYLNETMMDFLINLANQNYANNSTTNPNETNNSNTNSTMDLLLRIINTITLGRNSTSDPMMTTTSQPSSQANQTSPPIQNGTNTNNTMDMLLKLINTITLGQNSTMSPMSTTTFESTSTQMNRGSSQTPSPNGANRNDTVDTLLRIINTITLRQNSTMNPTTSTTTQDPNRNNSTDPLTRLLNTITLGQRPPFSGQNSSNTNGNNSTDPLTRLLNTITLGQRPTSNTTSPNDRDTNINNSTDPLIRLLNTITLGQRQPSNTPSPNDSDSNRNNSTDPLIRLLNTITLGQRQPNLGQGSSNTPNRTNNNNNRTNSLVNLLNTITLGQRDQQQNGGNFNSIDPLFRLINNIDLGQRQPNAGQQLPGNILDSLTNALPFQNQIPSSGSNNNPLNLLNRITLGQRQPQSNILQTPGTNDVNLLRLINSISLAQRPQNPNQNLGPIFQDFANIIQRPILNNDVPLIGLLSQAAPFAEGIGQDILQGGFIPALVEPATAGLAAAGRLASAVVPPLVSLGTAAGPGIAAAGRVATAVVPPLLTLGAAAAPALLFG